MDEKYVIFKNITILPKTTNDGVPYRKIDVIFVDKDNGTYTTKPIMYLDDLAVPFTYDMNYFIDEVMIYLADGKYHTVEYVEDIVEKAF